MVVAAALTIACASCRSTREPAAEVAPLRARTFAPTFNDPRDFWATTEGDLVALWWESDARASTYAVFRGPSSTGPWTPLATIPLPNAVDLHPDSAPVCDRADGLSRSNAAVRRYNSICVPVSGYAAEAVSVWRSRGTVQHSLER